MTLAAMIARTRLEYDPAVADELERLAVQMNRYRYVVRWLQADSYDAGAEFRARVEWASGHDEGRGDLSDNDLAEIGQQFLAERG